MRSRYFPLTLVFLLSLTLAKSNATAPDDDDANKAVKEAIESAKKAGINLDAVPKTLPDMGKDSDDDKPAEPVEKSRPPVTLPLDALPSWIPAIRGFQAYPKATRKQENGMETGAMTGTSTETADSIAEAWHTAAVKEKLNFARTTSNMNGDISIRVTISDSAANGKSAELILEPRKKTTVEVSYTAPVEGGAPPGAEAAPINQ